MADVKKHCIESLKTVPLGKDPAQMQNGKDFYKYLFTNHPDLRKYFKGAENFTADDVQKSARFEKQGTSLLLSVHLLANTFDNEMLFRAFCRETLDRHVGRGLDPSLYKVFWDVWMAFLESRGTQLTADQKAAWAKLGAMFNEECQLQLAKHGLPHL
ncbi:hypothetical protein V3C99_014261 [Haemonchus contortus]|uniref:GLOBIN domain-containing protein n=1 Tax=Haemonchus contortus TaxID=6289 RepID=A0A7I4YSV7_HAECO|nr:Globin domain containing protein [Haemonchus contortus]